MTLISRLQDAGREHDNEAWFNNARGPQAIGNVLSELMARRGYARVQSTAAYGAGVARGGRSAGGQVYPRRPVCRGTLEVSWPIPRWCRNWDFRSEGLLETLAELLPDEGIKNLRFRVGSVE